MHFNNEETIDTNDLMEARVDTAIREWIAFDPGTAPTRLEILIAKIKKECVVEKYLN